MKIKLIIADDNHFIREGLRIILNTYPEFEVLSALSDGREALDYCLSNEVDVALLDVRMPNMNGVEASAGISEHTNTKPLILTTFDDDEYILEAVKSGARGYLLKNNEPEIIRDAIKSVHKGNAFIQDIVMEKIKKNLHEAKEPALKIDKTLFTEREIEVMALIAKGLSNKEVSRKLFISEGTAANYISSILGKTGLEHRTQIAIYFLKGNLG
ncbi:response regulator [Peribacillus sp. SCS-26]|uniref:response regulator transcription factor n=1 Tax=Paraperibacillus marinus TaxID=3115295 RepID=UPI00390643FB